MRKRSNWLKKVFAFILVAAMVIQPITGAEVAKAAASGQYEIYPTPQSVTYGDDTFIIRSSVNVVYEEGIDDVTKNKLEDVLESKGISFTASNEKVDGTTNILVGTYGSEGYVDQYADSLGYSADLFGEIDPYVLDIDNGTITILGGNTDSAFYGIVSLMHIFNQIDGKTIRNLTIEDYADTRTRGFIEGYYGIPWSNEDRMSLMEFGGQFKMTSYVFAPKDDPYHSAQWRTPYPADKLAEIEEMAEFGNANKCRFVWTIHPFMNGGITAASYDTDIVKIIAKFEQLYEAGVRQFGVLGDDAGSLPRSVVIQTMNDLQEWVEEKGDVYNLVFCPGGYNDSWQGDYSELNEYDAGFPADIDIFWTGQAVCQPVEQLTLDNFREKNLPSGREPRRSPLFWLNWPVNDINMSRLMMGKGSLLHNDVNPEDLSGVVTNPMQDAEASKVALFAVADFAWNVSAFNDDQNWADGFKYIDAEATEALHTLAKHMSDPSPNGHGLVLAESEELQPLLEEFKEDYEAGTYNAELAEDLIAEFEEIMAACDEFHALSKNAKLKEEILPFSNALKELSKAVIDLIKTAKALEEGDSSNVWTYYSAATAELAASESYDRATLNGTAIAKPGSKHIKPFADKLNELLSVAVNGVLDDSKIIVSLITNRTDTPSGAFEKLTDNNEGTEVIWSSPNSTTAGTYIGLSYSKPITLNDVTFKMGQSGNANDTFDAAKIQYTEDGKTWIDLEGTEFTARVNNVTKDGLNLQVKGVRLISTADKGNMWLGCKDIIVNIDSYSTEEETDPLNKTVIKSSGWTVYEGSEGNLTDGSVSSGVWYQTPNNETVAGDYIGLDLGEVVEVGKVTFAVGLDSGDKWTSYKLEYSTDNTTWTAYETYEGASSGQDVQEENLGGVEARYVRISNLAQKGCWVKFGEFDVERYVEQTENPLIYTNVEALKNLATTESEAKDSIAINATQNLTLNANEYVGLKLERIKDITDIEVTTTDTGLTLESSKNEAVWTAVSGDSFEDARYVRLVNKTDAAITFDLTAFVVESHEIEAIHVEETTFASDDDNPHLNAFDQDRTTEANLASSQTVGRYMIYDLGQVIDLTSLKIVLHDGEHDYARHAKISVSADKSSWEDVLFIGDQNAANLGEADNTDNISELYPVHETSYYTKAETFAEKQVRYIKFEITRTKEGADKWVRFQEIELNGGDMYLPETNDPTVVTTGTETTGNTAMNIIDGDVSTTFKPAVNEAGSTTYYISENTDMNKITILQSPSTISNAVVSAEVMENGEVKTVEIGTLLSSLNEFDVSKFDHVLSINVAWTENNVPEIHEVITSTATVASADKATLSAYYEAHKAEDTITWTADSKQTYLAALDVAKEVIDNEYATQAMVDSAYISLKNAVEDKVEIGNIAAFKENVAAVKATVLPEENYTAKSYRIYAERLAAAEAVDSDSQLSQAELDEVAGALTEAINGLVYEIESMEELTLLLETAKTLKEEDYTNDSYEAFEAVSTRAEAMVEAGKTERQNPIEVKALIAELEEAMEALVGASEYTELEAAIEKAEKVDKDRYTEASYAELAAAVSEAKALSGKGTPEEVEAAIAKMEEKISKLYVAESICNEMIAAYAGQSGNYTEASLAELNKVVSAAYAKAEDGMTEAEFAETEAELKVAAELLVATDDLLEAIEKAEAIEEELYTSASYAKYAELIEGAKALLKDGTVTAIADMTAELNNPDKYLAKIADFNELQEAIDKYEAIDLTKYTEETKKALLDEIDKAKFMLTTGDVSEEQIDAQIKALEAAYKNLKEKSAESDNKPADKPSDETQGESPVTGDTSMLMLYVVFMMVAALVFAAVRRRKMR